MNITVTSTVSILGLFGLAVSTFDLSFDMFLHNLLLLLIYFQITLYLSLFVLTYPVSVLLLLTHLI